MTCVVPDCFNNRKTCKNENKCVSFFRFPKDRIMKKKWRDVFSLKKIGSDEIICSEHFFSSDLNVGIMGKPILKKSAVPFNLNPLIRHRSAIIEEINEEYDVSNANFVETEVENNRNSSATNCVVKNDEPQKPHYGKITIKAAMHESSDSEATKNSSKIDPKNVRRKIKLSILRKTLRRRTEENIRLKNKIRFQDTKISTLEQKLKILTKNDVLPSEEYVNLLNLSEPITAILKRQNLKSANKSVAQQYPPEIRAFAVNLSYYSPKAYEVVPSAFNNLLPHIGTVSEWYKTIDAQPGLTKESFDTIKMLSEAAEEKLFVNLVYDEMHIREQIEKCGSKVYGYAQCAGGEESETMASQVLVFMAVFLNRNIKIPLGYFPISTLTARQKENLVRMCLENLFESGVTVIGVTFDGCPTNFSVANYLGGQTVFPNLDPAFKFKFKGEVKDLLLFPDPVHMLKNVRNCLGEKEILIDNQGETIKWEFFEKLVLLQEKEGLHLGNKLRKAHVYFKQNKMNVRLATQLLSESVADAMEFVSLELKLPEFDGCRPTIKFVRQFNRIFDILNSRKVTSQGFKKAVCPENIDMLSEYIPTAIEYISTLKFPNGQLVCKSQRRIGFVGLILCLKTVTILFKNYIPNLECISFYRLNQDHIELFFSLIRSKSGYNNNPTVRQFVASYKRLLVHSQLKDGVTGNCLPLEDLSILTSNKKRNGADNRATTDFDEHPNLNILDEDLHELNKFTKNVVHYISGYVVRSLSRKLRCDECQDLLIGNKINGSLINTKNRGGLINPHEDVIKICELTEKWIRQKQKVLGKKFKLGYDISSEITLIVRKIIVSNDFYLDLKKHDHFNLLTKLIVEKFLRVRFFYMAKQSKKQVSLRHKYTKLPIFQGT